MLFSNRFRNALCATHTRSLLPMVTANIYSDLYDSELDTVATNLDRMHENSASPTGQEPDTRLENP